MYARDGENKPTGVALALGCVTKNEYIQTKKIRKEKIIDELLPAAVKLHQASTAAEELDVQANGSGRKTQRFSLTFP